MSGNVNHTHWRHVRLGDAAELQSGISKSPRALRDPIYRPYLRVANVQDGRLDLTDVKSIAVERSQADRFELREGDVLMTEGGDNDKLGRGAVWKGQIEGCLHQNHVFAARPHLDALLPEFLAMWTASSEGRRYFRSCSKQTTNLASINASQVRAAPLLLPPIEEQRQIVESLHVWDNALTIVTRLLKTKRRFRRGLLEQILDRQVRAAPIHIDWEYPLIGDIAHEVSQRAGGDSSTPVFACSKYDGLVESLSYFGRQIFSSDTSNYKIVRRGQFAFPANHIEEGSIGLLRGYSEGLVSPIYVVFESNDRALPEFLYVVFKSSSYRQIFSAATNSSVNRRGSLRWSEFRKLRVPLPPLEEQQRIVDVILALEREIVGLERLVVLWDKQGRALLDKLLSGQLRLPAR